MFIDFILLDTSVNQVWLGQSIHVEHIMGIIKLLDNYYMIGILENESVGRINEHIIYKVTKTIIIPLLTGISVVILFGFLKLKLIFTFSLFLEFS